MKYIISVLLKNQVFVPVGYATAESIDDLADKFGFYRESSSPTGFLLKIGKRYVPIQAKVMGHPELSDNHQLKMAVIGTKNLAYR